LGRTVFRVVQESLTNVHKHARGAATRIRIAGSAGSRLTIEVVNRRPVAAGALLPGTGSGLTGLRERVELLGGDLVSGPAADGGWRVRVELPWPAAAPAGNGRTGADSAPGTSSRTTEDQRT
jgi:signal transduction histidine kinase